MLSFFFFFFLNCVKFTSSIFFFFFIIEHQLACLAKWLGFRCISDRAWVLILVSAFSIFFSYLIGMLEPGFHSGSRFTWSDRLVRSGFENYVWRSTRTCLSACEGGQCLWVNWNEFLCLTLLVEMDACGGLGFEQREMRSDHEGEVI